MSHKNVELRQRQYAAAADRKKLGAGPSVRTGETLNSRTLLRRNHADIGDEILSGFKGDFGRATKAESVEIRLWPRHAVIMQSGSLETARLSIIEPPIKLTILQKRW
jgi:hypothetical protein